MGRENSELKLLKKRFYPGRKDFDEFIKHNTSGDYEKLLWSCSDGNQEIFDAHL